MAGNISGLHQFADDVGPLPLKLLDDSYSTLSIALNTLSTFSNFYQDQGTTNAYTIQTTQYQFASYTDGLTITVRIANTNTGMSTLNVNGLGAKHILTAIGTELQPNALVAGSMVTFIFNAQRDAWQISDSGASGQITAPLHITNPTGQSALSINVDGSGYLGDFNGNGLSWDGNCNFTFEGGATLSGITTPFSVSDGTYDFFNMKVPTDPPGTASADECVVSIAPVGSHAHQTILCLAGATDGTVLQVWGAENTVADKWLATFHGAGWNFGDPAIPPGFTGPNPGTSFGVSISAGTNASDTAFLVTNDGMGGLQALTQFCIIRGDGSGAIGAAPNQLIWNAAGNFSTTGTATLPMPPLIDLPGINITNPQNGEALVYDQATNSWVNGAPVNALATLNDVALATPANGQSLTYNVTTQKWVNSTPVTLLEQLSNAHISGPASGQVLTYSMNPQPGWVNATIPGYNFLSNLGVGPNPQAGWVLTWDGQAWVGAAPGQVAQFPLSSLTDVGITTPLNRQVLTYDAPSAKWINAPAPSPSLATLPDVALTSQSQGQVLAWNATALRWENSSLPGGSVIALDTLMDTNISDPQNNEVLTWDYASARWVNRALPATFTPVFTSPQAGQFLTYNGTSWVNSALAQALATLTDVTLTSAATGDLLTYNGTHWVNNGNAVIRGTAGANALTVTSPVAAVAVLNSTAATGTYLTWQVNGTAIGDIGSAAGNIGSGTASDMSINSRSGSFILATGNGNRLNINQTGNVTVNVPTSGIALTVNSNSDSQLVLNTPVGQQYVTQSWRVGGAVKAQAYWDDTGQTFNVGASPGGGTNLLSNDQVRMTINSAGNVTFNPPTSGWVAKIQGGSYGLVVNAGTSAASSALQVYPAAGTGIPFLDIRGDGSGSLGPQGALNWTNTGNFTITAPTGGTSMAAWVNGNVQITGPLNPSQPGLVVNTANNASNSQYSALIQNSAIASGPSYGLCVRAGLTQPDVSLLVQSQDQNVILFRVNGNGYLYAGNMGSGSGSPIVYAPGGQITLQSSTARFKRDIRTVRRNRVKETIAKLRTVSYRSTCEADDPDQTHYGLIAEEVAAVDPCLVHLDKEGRPFSVAYDRIAMLLLPLMQELLGMDEPEGEVYG